MRTNQKYVPSLIQNVCPQITHERIESSACPRQRLGIPHLLSISFPPRDRLLMWEIRRCLVSHEGERVEKVGSRDPSAECGERRSGTEYGFSHDYPLQTPSTGLIEHWAWP